MWPNYSVFLMLTHISLLALRVNTGTHVPPVHVQACARGSEYLVAFLLCPSLRLPSSQSVQLRWSSFHQMTTSGLRNVSPTGGNCSSVMLHWLFPGTPGLSHALKHPLVGFFNSLLLSKSLLHKSWWRHLIGATTSLMTWDWINRTETLKLPEFSAWASFYPSLVMLTQILTKYFGHLNSGKLHPKIFNTPFNYWTTLPVSKHSYTYIQGTPDLEVSCKTNYFMPK